MGIRPRAFWRSDPNPLSPRLLRRSVPIALVVGCLLNLINNAGALAEPPDAAAAARIALTFIVPWANVTLGMVLAERSHRQERDYVSRRAAQAETS